MKRYMATFIGTATAAEKSGWSKLNAAERKAIESQGMAAWGEWMARHAANILDPGAPLGKTKRASSQGISDTANSLNGLCDRTSRIA